MTNMLVRRMLDAVETQYADVITLRTVSTHIGRQPAYLGRLFRQEVGATFREHLTRVRLEHATALIHEGVKIDAIALSVGYRSKKNFYQQFKRHYTTTPLLYRSQAVAPTRCDRETSLNTGPPFDAVPDAPRVPNSAQANVLSPPESKVFCGTLVSTLRTSNRAWRLAVRAQRLLLKHFRRLRVGILLTNDAGRYIGANPAAARVTGYSITELMELSPTDLFVDASRIETRCVWQFLLVRPDLPVEAPSSTVRTKAGEPVTVRLVSFQNFLWGRREMSTMLGDAVVAAG
jgi:PAS domain S-box-containing protein